MEYLVIGKGIAIIITLILLVAPFFKKAREPLYCSRKEEAPFLFKAFKIIDAPEDKLKLSEKIKLAIAIFVYIGVIMFLYLVIWGLWPLIIVGVLYGVFKIIEENENKY